MEKTTSNFFLPYQNHKHQLLYLLFFLTTTSTLPLSSLSEIKNTRILDDARPMILFERFGFTQEGHVAITLNEVSWKSKLPNTNLNPSALGFFLVREPLFPQILNESETNPSFCVLSSKYIKPIFKFDKLTLNMTYDGSTIIEEPDEYSLIFGNCHIEFSITMKVRTEMFNIQNGVKNYLPAGQTSLPKLNFLFFLIYLAFFAIWIFAVIKKRRVVERIHIIMAGLLLCKALKMICASEDKLYVGKTGTPHGWDVAFYVFGFFKGVMLFTVIVLIGTGWTFLKPYLQEREKKVLVTIIPLQVLENIASAIIGETGPATKDWMTWNQIFLIIDIMCCCAVFFPIIWSIRSLREASKSDGKASRNLEKLTLFKQFYIVVVGYLYFTRVVVLALGAIISYRYEWVTVAASEVASLAFYVFIFHNFQPIEKNPYLEIDEEEELAAGQLLDEDDSFDL
ncbi:hypothetical protein UlMin_030005 [Ulmus minor]